MRTHDGNKLMGIKAYLNDRKKCTLTFSGLDSKMGPKSDQWIYNIEHREYDSALIELELVVSSIHQIKDVIERLGPTLGTWWIRH